MNKHSSLEETITSSNEAFKDFESDMMVGIRQLDNLIRRSAENRITVKQTAGSLILTSQRQAKKSDLWDIEYIFVKLYTRTDCKDYPRESLFMRSTVEIIARLSTESEQKLFTLRGRSIVGGRRDNIRSIIAHQGYRLVHCGLSVFHFC